MKVFILLAVCFAAANAWGAWNEGLSVRFDIGFFGAGTNFFITIPRTVASAKNSRWVETTRPAGPLSSLVMYCPSQNDVVVCALFDDLGDVAGLQIALPEDVWTDHVFDMAIQGYTRWTAPANTNGVVRAYWTTQLYFVSEQTLMTSKEERLATRAQGRVLKEEAVWVTGFNGELVRISGVADEVTNTAVSGFTEQACIVLMGRHYYYDMSPSTPCTSEKIFPWFPMVDKSTNQLIAVGFMTFGKLPAESLAKDYFERPTRSDVEMIVPSGPQCLYDLTENSGTITMHIYFVDSPFLINCINN